ncbi:MAG: DUF4446 family protein [Actinomycetota bacterium]
MSGSTVAVIILTALVILLLVWVGLISYNLGLLRRSQRILTRGMTDSNLAEILAQHFVRTDSLEDRIAQLEHNVAALHDIQLGAVQRIGLVRYDAFRDMGGELSFALALLDERGDGVVVSTITGRQDNRTYVKQVKGGQTDVSSSAEEDEAIKQAMSGR